jgi:hypothetical protein
MFTPEPCNIYAKNKEVSEEDSKEDLPQLDTRCRFDGFQLVMPIGLLVEERVEIFVMKVSL